MTNRLDPWIAFAVGLLAFAAYVFAAAPTPYVLDSAELATAAFGLGVAHPPGEETTLLFAKAWTLLPLGNVAFKVALSQAAAGALAAVLVYFIMREALQAVPLVQEKVGPKARAALAAATALAFAFAPGVVAVSDRAEVYALQTALSLAGILLALRARVTGDVRLAMVAALTIGLGVGNHSLVAGFVGVAAVATALPLLAASTARARFVAYSVVAFAVGLVVHAYLPLRTEAIVAAAERGVDNVLWGDARSLSGFWWVVSAQTFAEKTGIVHGNASPWDLPFLFFEELQIAFALLAPAGLYLLLRRSSSRPVGLAVVIGAVGSMAAALVGGLDPGNPDIRGYLGPAIALAAVLSAVAVATGLAFVRQARLRAVLATLFVVAATSRFPASSHYPGLRHAAAADDDVRGMMTHLPPTPVLLTSHFETGFLVGYQRFVEASRPDAAWAHLAFAAGPGYAERVSGVYPELAGLLQAAGRRPGELPGELRVLDYDRTTRIEANVMFSPTTRRSLGPCGELWGPRAHARSTPLAPLSSWALAEASNDNQVRAYLAWRNYIDAVWACGLDMRDRAAERFAHLEQLVPQDKRFADLRASCH